MATAPVTTNDPSTSRAKRRQTAHLKLVPSTRALREQLRRECEAVAGRLDKSRPLSKDEMESVARELLERTEQPEGFLGWTMVMLAASFWKDQVAAVPPSRRLFLLPHCLKHAEGCPADYDQFGLDCKQCGACSIADFRSVAEELGYRVLVAEGSPIVLKIIVSGYVDAIVGVACLNVLEKAIDKILLAGIPCMAVPLLSSDCRNTSVDEEWVSEMIHLRGEAPATTTRSYVHLMRTASELFQPEELTRLAPPQRQSEPRNTLQAPADLQSLEPLAATELLAYDFLARGGKYARPFITLAAYDALQGARCTLADGATHCASLPDSVRRTAMAIETFHKASLVHDDIEDDDQYRYGNETLHCRYGVPTAINVGDYLIGMGYRLVAREAAALGPDACADIIDTFSDAHVKLSEGQGAELAWRDMHNKRLTPLDALKVYALKTAPAFEAALLAGARLAGPAHHYRQPIRLFARNLGVAFQILNDLKDWEGDNYNKLAAGGDITGGRPTLLLALALESLPPDQQQSLLQLLASDATEAPALRLEKVRRLYQRAGVFEKAHRLVDKHQQRAESIADELDADELRRLLYFLVDTVLERSATRDDTASPLLTLSGLTTSGAAGA